MIDTFALFGKSTWEKILLPKLFKQTTVKFSFLVTNLTFQGSDSRLAERGRNWCLLGVLDLQILPGVPWIWKCGTACPCGAPLAVPGQEGDGRAWGCWDKRGWHIVWGHFAVAAACLKWLCLNSVLFPWFELTSGAAPEAEHVWQLGNDWGREWFSHRIMI